MTEQSTPHDPGKIRQQWYEVYPERLQDEIQHMRSAHSSFTFHKVDGKNVYWTGEAKAFKPDGSVLASLPIKIECDIDYPKVFPIVTDTSATLKDRKCPHLSVIDGVQTLCYGNRLDTQIDFEGATRVKDVVDYVGIFIARQWYFENYGEWPDGQPHGELAFLEYEVTNSAIDPTSACPCGLYTKKYSECHMPKLWQVLVKFESILKREVISNIKLKRGRNQKCLCGNSKKYKKCCLHKINYNNSKIFLLLKFPETFGIDIAERDKMLEAIVRSM